MQGSFFGHMACFVSSIQLVTVYYDGVDSESYAPDRAYITGLRGKTGSVTICLECADEDTSFLTLIAHRSVISATSSFGEHIVRIITPVARIDLHVNSAEAQDYWVEALACNDRPGLLK